ncbi:helix-turn-helix transcriptional regulator [Sandaracinobacteroides saxicola]|uniref:LuxR family transcriptional regulator n=1 Tax=Sandaracinobacteroides saxicola TaxID=2759707 RepID=A0A7G5IKZ0_9SPHN|nr:LuxR family transcriptional regulator [Sandaracinobacteroides saxicola]QMW24032.1 LuxR family transcriptional regulator [Sandaracinobacteroides saxicola]
MTAFATVQAFVEDVKQADSLGEIAEQLSCATRAFSFDHYALTQRYGLRIDEAPVQMTDYPPEWIGMLAKNDYWVNDPVLAACQRSVAPFNWDDLPDIIPMNSKQQGYMRAAANRGLAKGYTVPIHIPGEATALCSFVLTQDRALPRESLPAAQYLACFAFEAARKLAGKGGPEGPKLTKRQLECVVLAARGKSDWVAAQILGLAPDTVHKYIESAKARYGVSSRTELVVRALYDGQLGFGDLLS